jgi:DHA1 family bicyclomycin/chloramphenicol resistance-like MFS transporter
MTLALLAAIAPLATDMYLPGFVAMTDEFDSSASAVQLTLPNAPALASDRARQAAGTGSALLGGAQFLLAAIVTPLVGLGSGALPMAIGMLACAIVAAASLTALTRADTTPPAVAHPEPVASEVEP